MSSGDWGHRHLLFESSESFSGFKQILEVITHSRGVRICKKSKADLLSQGES